MSSQLNLAGQVPGMHGQAAEGHDVGQRREPVDHPKLLVHRGEGRVGFRHLLVLGPPDLLADAQVPLDLVPLLHHLQ